MLTTVKLDNETRGYAHKIRDISRNRMLPTEFEPHEIFSA
jgi:hypothetical protein